MIVIEEAKIEKETKTNVMGDNHLSQENPIVETIDEKDELENDFLQFKNTKTQHKVEKENTPLQERSDFIPDADELNEIEKFKVEMFLGFCFTLIDGFHVFLYKYISKYELKDEDLALDEADQAALMSYFKTKRILAIIQKIPPELIGLIHMEWMYFRKYKQVTKEREAEEEKKNKIKLIENFRKFKSKHKNKEDKKPPAKKQVVKKKPVKKKAKSEKEIK